MVAIPKAHPTNGAASDCVSLNSLYVNILFRLKQVLLDDLVSAGWGLLDIGAQDLVQDLVALPSAAYGLMAILLFLLLV